MKKLAIALAAFAAVGFLTLDTYAGCGKCGPKKAAGGGCGVECKVGGALGGMDLTAEQKEKIAAAQKECQEKILAALDEGQAKKMKSVLDSCSAGCGSKKAAN